MKRFCTWLLVLTFNFLAFSAFGSDFPLSLMAPKLINLPGFGECIPNSSSPLIKNRFPGRSHYLMFQSQTNLPIFCLRSSYAEQGSVGKVSIAITTYDNNDRILNEYSEFSLGPTESSVSVMVDTAPACRVSMEIKEYAYFDGEISKMVTGWNYPSLDWCNR